MRLIDVLNGISSGDIVAGFTFRINCSGYSFIIKYLKYTFEIQEVKSSYNQCLIRKGDKFDNFILHSLNYKIEYLPEGE